MTIPNRVAYNLYVIINIIIYNQTDISKSTELMDDKGKLTNKYNLQGNLLSYCCTILHAVSRTGCMHAM